MASFEAWEDEKKYVSKQDVSTMYISTYILKLLAVQTDKKKAMITFLASVSASPAAGNPRAHGNYVTSIAHCCYATMAVCSKTIGL